MQKTILVTGTLGFIFSNFIKRVINYYPEYRFVGVDKAVFSYNLDNMQYHKNYKFYLADISDAHAINRIFEIEKPDFVIGGAAESHVDNSITDVLPFLSTNIVGTQVLINACLKHNIERYIHISTDEVYGQTFDKNNSWTEDAPMLAKNPYSCSKAAAELVVLAAHHTHNLQYQITRSCNVFGNRQKKENLIPHIITSLLNERPVHIHGVGNNFRQYIAVDDKIDAIMTILQKGTINSIYNIGDNNYFTNNEMVENIGFLMGITPKVRYIPDRKAHDFGYSVNSDKLRALGWKQKALFNSVMLKAIQFYKEQNGK